MKRKALGGDYMVNVLSVGGTTPIPSFKKQRTKPGSHIAQASLRFPMQSKITLIS